MNMLAIEIDDLLSAIPGDQPAGDATAYIYRLREQINELRREELPTNFDDATRPANLKKADWAGVVQLCHSTLKQTSKDLRVACHLLEALVKTEGLAGLQVGLTLLARLFEDCWDRLLPPLEGNDYEERAELLENMLDDADRGVVFPNVVRRAPLFGTDEQRYSLLDWNNSTKLENSPEKDAIQAAPAQTTSDWTKQTAGHLAGCQEQFGRLCAVLQKRMGDAAPALTNLRGAISECQQFVQECLKHPASETAGSEQHAPASADSSAASRRTTLESINSRLDAYTLLGQAAEALARIEPHSPTPYLVRRAIELGRLPFPQWIPSLLREESVLADLLKGVENAATAGAR